MGPFELSIAVAGFLIALATFIYFIWDRHLTIPHSVQFDVKQVGFSRIANPNRPMNGHYVIFVHGIDLVNISQSPLTIRDVSLHCNLESQDYEVPVFTIKTGTALGSRGKKYDHVLAIHDAVKRFQSEPTHYLFLQWRNLNEAIAERKPILPGGTLNAEAAFLLPTSSLEAIQDLKEFTFAITDFHGRTTLHPIKMNAAWLQAAHQSYYRDQTFIADEDGKVKYDP